jgi:hypothetical protein
MLEVVRWSFDSFVQRPKLWKWGRKGSADLAIKRFLVVVSATAPSHNMGAGFSRLERRARVYAHQQPGLAFCWWLCGAGRKNELNCTALFSWRFTGFAAA